MSSPSPRKSLLLFLALVVGGGLAIGAVTVPGEWYARLNKPPFNPPGWIFGPVWTTLYVLIAIAGWRIWQRDRAGRAMQLWWGQLTLNFLWSPAFFAAQQIALALAVILIILATVLGFIATSRRQDPVAMWLLVPYAMWVGFAMLLNASILALN